MSIFLGNNLNIVCDGNSITKGHAAGFEDFNTSYPGQMQLRLKQLGITATVTNIGVSAQTTLDMIADSASVDTLLVPGAQNILIVSEGGNDFLFNNPTVQVAYDRFISYCLNRMSAGWYVIVFGNFPRNQPPAWGTNADFEAKMVAFDSMLGANYKSFCSRYVDIRRALPMIVPGSEYLMDNIHPSATGYILMATILAREVSLLRRKNV